MDTIWENLATHNLSCLGLKELIIHNASGHLQKIQTTQVPIRMSKVSLPHKKMIILTLANDKLILF